MWASRYSYPTSTVLHFRTMKDLKSIAALAIALGSPHAALGSALYWADQGGAVLRANMDGTGVQVLVTQSSPSTTGIALDLLSGQMYLTNQGDGGNVMRANLDGTNVVTLITGVSPFGVALDVTGEEMYWTDTGSLKDIRRAHLDGSAQQILVTGQDSPTGIALDIADGTMYWVNQFGGSLWRANLGRHRSATPA